MPRSCSVFATMLPALILLSHNVANKPVALFATVLPNDNLSLPQWCFQPSVSPPFFCQNIFTSWSPLPAMPCSDLICLQGRLLCFVASNWSLCSSVLFCVLWSLFATGLPLLGPSFPQAFPTCVTLCLTFAPLSIYFLNNAFSSLFPSLLTYYISRLGRNSSLWTMFSPVFTSILYCTLHAVHIIIVILLVWTCWPYSVSPGCLCLVGRC